MPRTPTTTRGTAASRTAPGRPAFTPTGIVDPLAMTVTPMSVRTDYQMSTHGHRMLGTLRGATVIDTGWHSTVAKAAAAYGRALATVAAANAARYTEAGR